jgi:hypothetical protein
MRFAAALSILSPRNVLGKGLAVLNVDTARRSRHWQEDQFYAHFSSDPLTFANQWYDLTTTTIPGAKLEEHEKSGPGLLMFLIPHHFLWTYPKNHKILASHFHVGVKKAMGKELWNWVGKIAALKEKMIVWHPRLDSQNSEIFIVTVHNSSKLENISFFISKRFLMYLEHPIKHLVNILLLYYILRHPIFRIRNFICG